MPGIAYKKMIFEFERICNALHCRQMVGNLYTRGLAITRSNLMNSLRYLFTQLDYAYNEFQVVFDLITKTNF